jgi:hypothetical protein
VARGVRLVLAAALIAAGLYGAGRWTDPEPGAPPDEGAPSRDVLEPQGARGDPDPGAAPAPPRRRAPGGAPAVPAAEVREPEPPPATDDGASPETRALIDGNVDVAARAVEVQVLRARGAEAREAVEREYEAARAAQRARLEAAGVLDPRSP